MMRQFKKRSLSKAESGFSGVEAFVVVLVVVILFCIGWYVWQKNHSSSKSKNGETSQSASQSDKQITESPAANPYANWKVGSSSRAGLTFKYPENWLFTNSIGTNDDVEHIVLASDKFSIKIDTYNGMRLVNGDTRDPGCPDCTALETENVTLPQLGKIGLETAKIGGVGNALILRQSDGTYFIPSTAKQGKYTTFQGTSTLVSVADAQNQTLEQFKANSDLATAKLILKSVAY